MKAHNDNTASQGDTHTPRVIRYEDYLADVRREREAQLAENAAKVASDREAFRRYQRSLMALPPRPKPAYTAGVSTTNVQEAPVLVDEPVNELTDHNYDGIQEYDNPTPGWWHLMFLGSVVFAVLYVFVYHMSGIVPSLPKRLANAETAALELRFAELNTMPMGEAKILRIMNQEQWLDQGATIYAGTCAVCHNANGSGGIGPNLTDETYKNIASLMDISDLVLNGTPNGAMPSQRNFMNENEVALVSAYAASLRGKNLPSSPNVKPEYEGVPIPAWPTIDDDGNVIPAPTTQASNR